MSVIRTPDSKISDLDLDLDLDPDSLTFLWVLWRRRRTDCIQAPMYPMTPIDIPLDLQIETLLRLPVKSLLRFRCVSKLWSSIITSRDFKNRHLSIATSSSPTHLLIAFENSDGEELLLVSSPNPIAPSSSSSSCYVPFRDLSLLKIHKNRAHNAARGLICVASRKVKICNPSTRDVHIFPRIKFKASPKVYPCRVNFLGYDPIGDQYKVLAFDNLHWRSEHKVLTLGQDKNWREAPCVVCSHAARTSGLCMNGTVYYGAFMSSNPSKSIVMSFDVRLETFDIINVPRKVVPRGHVNMWAPSMLPAAATDKTLINYRGKIGVVENPREGKFRLWVVEDAENEEWSVNAFHLPESVAAAGLDLKVMSTFSNGEICLVPKELSDPFRLFYYSLEKKSMRSVVIEELPVSELKQAKGLSVTVSDHYDSFMF